MSGGHICEAKAPTEAAAEMVGLPQAKPVVENKAFPDYPSVTCGDSSPDKGSLKTALKK